VVDRDHHSGVEGRGRYCSESMRGGFGVRRVVRGHRGVEKHRELKARYSPSWRSATDAMLVARQGHGGMLDGGAMCLCA
jgi:hypothetical protein